MFNALGKQVSSFEGFDAIDVSSEMLTVRLSCHEVTALCLVTSQPDFYTVDIEYEPDKLCLETKTLKLYLETYRSVGIFAEYLAAKISQDIAAAIRPKRLSVTVNQSTRGGIQLSVRSDYDIR